MESQFFYKNNRIQPLKGFICVVRTGSITEASKLLNLSQSAVTQQIQALERDLGVALFTRGKNKLTITKDGKELYDLAVQGVEFIDNLYENFLENKALKDISIIKIAANHLCILYVLPKVINEYKILFPQVEVVIENLPRDDALDKLAKGEIHCAIYPKNIIPAECVFIPIIRSNPILIMSKNNPLAKRKIVNLEDVPPYEFVKMDPHLLTFPMFEETLAQYNIKTSVHFKGADWEILKKFVAAGVGMTAIADMCFNEHDQEILSAKPLSKYFPQMVYGIFTKHGKHAPQVDKFIEIMKGIYGVE